MDEDFNIECSDDEIKAIAATWEPPPEEVVRIYNLLDKGELPKLNWKCPGYRTPSPDVTTEPEENEEEALPEDKSDFDFMDEVTLPKLKIRKDGEDALKGSAKKKTTSLDGVISNMRRHNLLPQLKNKTTTE